MTPEELLMPRYKVIADYPSNHLKVGTIIPTEYHAIKNLSKEMISFYEKYPHLFKKLEWWEEREQKEMPEYVKHRLTLEVYRFYRFGSLGRNYAQVKENTYRSNLQLAALLPATKEEYENQKATID